MKLAIHAPASAAALIGGAVSPDISQMTALYRQTLDENYGKNHDAVNEKLEELCQERLMKLSRQVER